MWLLLYRLSEKFFKLYLSWPNNIPTRQKRKALHSQELSLPSEGLTMLCNLSLYRNISAIIGWVAIKCGTHTFMTPTG